MDAIQFLLQEHKTAKSKFAEIEHASPQQRGALWQKLQPELKVHEMVEDTYLYGPLSHDPKAAGTKLAGFQEHQDKDVAEVEQMIAQANGLDPANSAWLDKVLEIRDALADHIKEEETEILPQIPQVWPQEKIDAAGEQMAAAKLQQVGKVA